MSGLPELLRVHAGYLDYPESDRLVYLLRAAADELDQGRALVETATLLVRALCVMADAWLEPEAVNIRASCDAWLARRSDWATTSRS